MFSLSFLLIGCGDYAIDSHVLINKHNQERKSNSLRELKEDYHLTSFAQNHAEWMAKYERMEHQNLHNIISGWDLMGENIAYGQKNESSVMNAWMNSPGHRKNILTRDFNKIGVGFKKSKSGLIFWCVVLGKN